MNVMNFLQYNADWSINKELLLSFQETQALIKERSGRELVLSSTLFKVSYDLFSLAHHPAIGFFIMARQHIPAQTPLFGYGGQQISASSVDGAFGDDEYIIDHDVFLDATKQGDLGALLMHLPGGDSERYLQIDSEHCFTSNCRKECVDNNVIFYSSKTIEIGQLIGYEYGLQYWINARKNPLHFNTTGHPAAPIHLDQTLNEPFLVCYDRATGHFPIHNGAINYFSFQFKKLLLDFGHIITDELKNKSIAGPSYSASNQKLIIENKDQQVNITVRELMDLCYLRVEGRLNPLTFFGVRTAYSGCEPPPNAEYRSGRTIIPSIDTSPGLNISPQ